MRYKYNNIQTKSRGIIALDLRSVASHELVACYRSPKSIVLS